jgi:hypothetical protein
MDVVPSPASRPTVLSADLAVLEGGLSFREGLGRVHPFLDGILGLFDLAIEVFGVVPLRMFFFVEVVGDVALFKGLLFALEPATSALAVVMCSR